MTSTKAIHNREDKIYSKEALSKRTTGTPWANISYAFDLEPKVFEAKIPDNITLIDEMPKWEKEVKYWICRNVRYPVIAQEKGITGKALAYFTVDVDGSIGDISMIDNGTHVILQNELIRLLNILPKAKRAGIYKGKKVKSGGYIVVNFQLN